MNKTRKDKEFFEEIYNTTFAGLRKFVTYRCTNSALVDDILQEVYIEVFRHIDQLREHENIAGWIYKTADNKTKKLNKVYHREFMVPDPNGIPFQIVLPWCRWGNPVSCLLQRSYC